MKSKRALGLSSWCRRALWSRSRLEHLLAKIPVVSFDVVAARIHAHLSADLAQRGEPVGAHDLLIGATAVALGFGVVTRDERSFPKLAGLNVLRW